MKKFNFWMSLLCLSSTVQASVLHDMRPCTRSSPFTAEQKPAYQPLKLVAPLVGYCLPVAGVNLEKVCMQGSYPASKEGEAEYFKVSYWRDAKQILEWRSDGFLMSPADSFSVELVNVDGDNALELVVTVMTGESMGMGVQSADIFVVDRQHLRVSEPMSVEDYGRVSGFYGKTGQACRLLVTSWESGEDQQKGSGLYAQGTWYQLKNTQWQPIKALPSISRRYLFRFQEERDKATAPLLWFLDKSVNLE